MTETLEAAFGTAREQSPDLQDALGNLVLAALQSDPAMLSEIERLEAHSRDQRTLEGLAQAERGEGFHEPEARQRMDAFLLDRLGSWKHELLRQLASRISNGFSTT